MADNLYPDEGEYTCTLDATTQEKALKELNEDPKQRQGAIQTLREWVKKQPHLKCRTGRSGSFQSGVKVNIRA